MGTDVLPALGQVDQLVGEGGRPTGERVVEVDPAGDRVLLEGAHPAEERRDADATRDPDLVGAALGMAEPAVRPAHHRGHPGLEELLQAGGVAAQRLGRTTARFSTILSMRPSTTVGNPICSWTASSIFLKK